MNRVNCILQNKEYQLYLAKNVAAEDERIFCRHNMEHFLDVARIAMLMNLEEGLGIDKEMVYATALLHDIGRWKEYEDGTPHEVASAELTPEILAQCGFTKEESRTICKAILTHRDASLAKEDSLCKIVYLADKKSRACHNCRARALCKWSEEKKNLTIEY